MTPQEAEAHVRAIANATKALRAARLGGDRLLLDETNRALLSGAVPADEKTGQWPITVCANTVACINRASRAMRRMAEYE